ncbi:hypothetical protein IID24_05360, partial [Patescibacteria group bacterium]|nr:hypothetical protein [Patescibacteria group bacterium]
VMLGISKNNLELIAETRNALPELITEVERLRWDDEYLMKNQTLERKLLELRTQLLAVEKERDDAKVESDLYKAMARSIMDKQKTNLATAVEALEFFKKTFEHADACNCRMCTALSKIRGQDGGGA